MMALSMERLAAIRARADAATPGPWRVDEGIAHSDPGFPEDAIWYRQIDGWRDLGPEHGCDWLWLSREDATFIAHAREDIPALLAEVERLRAKIVEPQRSVRDGETAMTTIDYARLRALAEQATPGPWTATCRDVDERRESAERSGLGWDVEGPPEAWHRGQFARGEDAEYIAAVHPQVLLTLLDEIDRLAALVDWFYRHPEEDA